MIDQQTAALEIFEAAVIDDVVKVNNDLQVNLFDAEETHRDDG